MAPSFQLLDLRSQAAAVRRALAGIPPDQVLLWLAERGSVTQMPAEFSDSLIEYRFESAVGAFCLFTFRDGVIFVVGENNAAPSPVGRSPERERLNENHSTL
jgi:hypothetical protein